MFSLNNPLALLVLFLPPLLAILRHFKILNRITYKTVLTNWKGQAFEYKNKSSKILSIMTKILTTISFIFATIAFCEPKISTQEKVYTSVGSDIIFVLDTSPSMMAKDMDGQTRLSVAKQEISQLLINNKGSRFALVVLGTDAALSVPPTFDQEYFSIQLEQVKVGKMGNGSSIGDGISTAVLHLSASTAEKKCIILLTDGENNAGEVSPETAAKLAAKNNITIYSIGIGTKGNVPIEYTDPSSGKLYFGYYNSAFNAQSLIKISATTKGEYFEAKNITELSEVLNNIAREQSVRQGFTYKTVTKSLYKNFLLIAIIAMLFSWIIKKIILKELQAFFLQKSLAIKRALQVLYFVFLIFAYIDFSWGSYILPVKKTSHAISFVFDISNSMNATDCPNENTRLTYAAAFAEELLENMGETSASVILAKGDGIEVLPLTEDKSYIFSLLEILSTNLLTSPGTSLEKGILKAIDSFPQNISASQNIWLFTDGEETLGQMSKALSTCIEKGIKVCIIGFGSVSESSVMAGDGKSLVNTALREDKIKSIINSVNEKYKYYKNCQKITYINANEKGSGQKLLSQINDNSKENIITSYEIIPLTHHTLFFILAFSCLILSYLLTEFNFKKLKLLLTSSIILVLFVSCSNSKTEILKGSVRWNQGKFSDSVENYYKALEKAKKENNQKEKDIALYNLGTAYMMMGEFDSALDKYMEISKDAEDSLLFSVYYNAGVIEYDKDNFESARVFFKKALEIDSSRIDAKINFELSRNFESAKTPQKDGQSFEASLDSTNDNEMADKIFEHIKENEKKQWKSNEETPQGNLTEDY